MKFVKTLSTLFLAAVLAACGGGGGSPGSTTGGSSTTTTTTTTTTVTPPEATPATIEIQASANEILSAGAEVTITVVVKSATNVGMPDQAVSFEVDNATLQGAQAKTNSDGVATARLSAGANKALRNVTVKVSSASASSQITLPVTGTRLTLTGASAIKAGASAEQFVVRLVDSSGNGISGATINISSLLNNGLNSTNALTSSSGQVTFLYTANNAGVDTLSVGGAGASASTQVTVSAIDFVVLVPADNEAVLVNTNKTITVRYRNNQSPVAGTTVLFSTTKGLLSATSAVTDANGQASVSVNSPSAGPASVVAQIAAVGQVTLPLQFVATVPATLVLQANPGSVLVNTGGGTTNQSTIEATVRDALGNAVANRQVNFSVLSDDGNGGTLSSPTAITDINGRAQVQFVPGAKSTRANGVEIEATVASTLVSGKAVLTVNGQALFISIGFGNTISNKDETTYSKPFSVYVTDANGNAVGNQLVTLSVIPSFYGRGSLGWSGAVWAYRTGVKITCPNEDLNFNGSLDPGEDVDSNNQLTPGSPVVVAPGSVTTDGLGRATFALEYGEQYAPWLVVSLSARALVGGTESRNSYSYFLSGLASDFSNETIPPAGQVSPFGETPLCP